MRKNGLALLGVAALGMGLSGCGTTLTTSETCVEVKAIIATFPDTMPEDEKDEKELLKETSKKFEELAGKSSETLKEAVGSMAKVLVAGSRGEEASGELQDKAEVVQSVCDL